MEYNVLRKQYLAKMCFVCGTENDCGIKTQYYVLEHDRVLGICRGEDAHQSFPSRMHGGLIAALLDEAIGRALQIHEPNSWAVTIELHVKYHKPVPLNEDLYVIGWLNSKGRIFKGEGYIMDTSHVILATCEATYFRQNVKDIIGTDTLGDGWQPDTKALEFERIDLPR